VDRNKTRPSRKPGCVQTCQEVGGKALRDAVAMQYSCTDMQMNADAEMYWLRINPGMPAVQRCSARRIGLCAAAGGQCGVYFENPRKTIRREGSCQAVEVCE